jgi:hypothetical protein
MPFRLRSEVPLLGLALLAASPGTAALAQSADSARGPAAEDSARAARAARAARDRAGASGAARAAAPAPGTAADVPALPPSGTRLEYGLSLGPIHAGHATLTVGEAGEVGGVEAYPVTLQIEGGALFLTLDDSLVSWIAAGPLRTLRSDRSVHEGPHKEVYRLELDGGAGEYRIVPLPGVSGGPSADRPRSGPSPADALDDVAVLFLPRALPLDPGADYVIPRFFRANSNPVRLHVAERRSMRTPAGRFQVVGLDVVIPETGLFAEKRHARVYVTDDADRTLVQLTADTVLGKLRLYLTGEGQ